MTSFSLLSYNFVSLPWCTRGVCRRLDRLFSEIGQIKPDIICFQEIWLASVRRRILAGLKPLGYADSYFTSAQNLIAGKNGLFFVSRVPIEGVASIRLASRWLGFNWSLTEFFVSKGYSHAKISLEPGNNLHVFNVHLSAQYRQDIKNIHSPFNRAKALSLKKLAVAINTLGKQKIIAVGDFNFPPQSWFYDNFLAWTGLTDTCPREWSTVLPSRIRISIPKLYRTDYVFTKNISTEQIKTVEQVWDKPFYRLGYLSDHAALLAKFQF